HGDHERHCSSRWTTAADEKWGSDPDLRLTTHRDRNDEVLTKWAGTLPTIEDLGLHVETGRHIKSRDRRRSPKPTNQARCATTGSSTSATAS
ncbi:MAG: hypothetical protein OXG35_04235, partial [Acidobacteria bacterium]|nr:hypothetical protein [Acidobacteriota bacterium]